MVAVVEELLDFGHAFPPIGGEKQVDGLVVVVGVVSEVVVDHLSDGSGAVWEVDARGTQIECLEVVGDELGD